jgi:hypothetical protein
MRAIDYIEGVGQTLGYYVTELRKRDYRNALCVLPAPGKPHFCQSRWAFYVMAELLFGGTKCAAFGQYLLSRHRSA